MFIPQRAWLDVIYIDWPVDPPSDDTLATSASSTTSPGLTNMINKAAIPDIGWLEYLHQCCMISSLGTKILPTFVGYGMCARVRDPKGNMEYVGCAMKPIELLNVEVCWCRREIPSSPAEELLLMGLALKCPSVGFPLHSPPSEISN